MKHVRLALEQSSQQAIAETVLQPHVTRSDLRELADSRSEELLYLFRLLQDASPEEGRLIGLRLVGAMAIARSDACSVRLAPSTLGELQLLDHEIITPLTGDELTPND